MTEFTGEIHPYAAIFPMLPDEDLKALADDIAANGQLHPILLTPEGVLIDGRNRLAACDLAGVEPRFEVTEADPVALVMSANLQRRDLPSRRKAFHAVASRRFVHGLTSSITGKVLAAIAGVDPTDIARAEVVLKFTPETFQAVLDGRDEPTPAYQAAKAEKERLELNEQRTAELRDRAPDLLGLAIEEAWAAYQARTKEAREHAAAIERNRQETSTGLASAVVFLAARSRGDFIAQTSGEYQPDDVPPSMRLTADSLDHAIRTLTTIRQEPRFQ